MYSGKGIAMLLISLGIGYWVCIQAEAQKKGFLKQLGYWLGSIIIVLSILMSLCQLRCQATKKKYSRFGKIPGQACPIVKR